MTKQLKFTSLLLLVTAITFAQKPQNIVNTTKSNIKDKVAVDSVKKTNTDSVQNQIYNKSKSNVVNNRPIVLDSSKIKTTEQARITGVSIPNVGTVVKKNPGGGASRVGTTNDKGEVIFSIKEKGDYTITLVNDSGGVGTNNSNAAAMSKGGPVKGVKVGLGKNPTGKLIATNITNDKGEVEFKNLEIGSYTLLVQAPCPFAHEWKDGKCVPVGDKTTNPTKEN